jgi:hypothetical protein
MRNESNDDQSNTKAVANDLPMFENKDIELT